MIGFCSEEDIKIFEVPDMDQKQKQIIIQFEQTKITNLHVTKVQARLIRRWQSPCSNNQGINLDNLFSTPRLDAVKLLNMDNIVDEVKRQNDKFTQKLIANPQILHQLIQICLRPTHFKHEQLQKVTNIHTYKALEILTNLTEEFTEYLITGELNPNLRNSESDNDDVVTQQIQQQSLDWNKLPIVVHVFNLLRDPKPIEQTPLWYMHKISTSMCYQKPKHTMRLFSNKELCMLVFQHFYSNSILEWLVKLIEMEDSTTFFEKEKVELFKNFIDSLKKQQKNLQLKIAKYENYESVLETMLQKMQDRFDKSKYTNLAKLIFSQKYPIEFIIDEVESYCGKYCVKQQESMAIPTPEEQQLFNISLLILQKYLHFSSVYRTNLASNTNNNNSSLNMSNNKGNNLGSGMFSGAGSVGNVLDTSVYAEIVLNSACLKRIWAIASIHTRSSILAETQKSDHQLFKQSLPITLSFLKLVKTLFISLQTLDHEHVHTVMAQGYVKYLLSLLSKYRNCNILHNIVRDILIEAINKNYQEFVPVLMNNANANNTGFVQMISQMKGKINSGDNQYQNQLYHVFQTVLKKCGEDQTNMKIIEGVKTNVKGFDQLQSRIKDKQKIYNTQIGGNPRKQSSCWGDSSQDEKMFQFNFTNAQYVRDVKDDEQIPESPTVNDNLETNLRHWYDCGGLPLDSDQSKDSGALQTSQPLEKEDQTENHYRIRQNKKKQSKNQEQQWSANSIENQLVQKFKNFGVVQCQQQQIRIPARKNRYSDSKKKKPELNIEESNQKNQQKIKDSSQLELEREIKILEAKRMHNVGSLQQDRSPQIKIRVKKKVDSIQEQQQNNENYYPDGQMLLVKSVDSVDAIETLTNSKDKNKDIERQKKDIQSQKVILLKGSQNQHISKQRASKLDIPTVKNNETIEQSHNLYKQHQNLSVKSPRNSRSPFSPRSPRSPRSKPKSQNQINSANSANSNGSKQGLHNPFPKYLNFQIEQILSELE